MKGLRSAYIYFRPWYPSNISAHIIKGRKVWRYGEIYRYTSTEKWSIWTSISLDHQEPTFNYSCLFDFLSCLFNYLRLLSTCNVNILSLFFQKSFCCQSCTFFHLFSAYLVVQLRSMCWTAFRSRLHSQIIINTTHVLVHDRKRPCLWSTNHSAQGTEHLTNWLRIRVLSAMCSKRCKDSLLEGAGKMFQKGIPRLRLP